MFFFFISRGVPDCKPVKHGLKRFFFFGWPNYPVTSISIHCICYGKRLSVIFQWRIKARKCPGTLLTSFTPSEVRITLRTRLNSSRRKYWSVAGILDTHFETPCTALIICFNKDGDNSVFHIKRCKRVTDQTYTALTDSSGHTVRFDSQTQKHHRLLQCEQQESAA